MPLAPARRSATPDGAPSQRGLTMTEQQDMSSGQETTIVDNEVYNVIAALANKL